MPSAFLRILEVPSFVRSFVLPWFVSAYGLCNPRRLLQRVCPRLALVMTLCSRRSVLPALIPWLARGFPPPAGMAAYPRYFSLFPLLRPARGFSGVLPS